MHPWIEDSRSICCSIGVMTVYYRLPQSDKLTNIVRSLCKGFASSALSITRGKKSITRGYKKAAQVNLPGSLAALFCCKPAPLVGNRLTDRY